MPYAVCDINLAENINAVKKLNEQSLLCTFSIGLGRFRVCCYLARANGDNVTHTQ